VACRWVAQTSPGGDIRPGSLGTRSTYSIYAGVMRWGEWQLTVEALRQLSKRSIRDALCPTLP
jgi:hypothetical protein